MAEETVKKDLNERIIRPPREWPGRLKATLFVLISIMIVAALIVILKNDLVNKKIEEVENKIGRAHV